MRWFFRLCQEIIVLGESPFQGSLPVQMGHLFPDRPLEVVDSEGDVSDEEEEGGPEFSGCHGWGLGWVEKVGLGIQDFEDEGF